MENWLTKRVLLSGSKLALVTPGASFTFKELQDNTLAWAGKLISAGISLEKPVAILSFNSLDLYLSILALQQLGVSMVFLNPRLSHAELTFQLADCNADFVIGQTDLLSPLTQITTLSFSEIASNTPAKFNTVSQFPLEQVTSIMYTSGTTGQPKGVLQTFGNHWWSANASLLNLGLSAEDSWILAVPLFHISGLSMLMKGLIYGVPIYLFEHFQATDINRLLINGEGTNISVVTTMLEALLTDLGDRYYHPNLKCILLGGGPISDSLLEHCVKKNIPVVQSYGMTETASQVVALNLFDAKKKIGSAGLPLFPTQLRIASNDLVLKPNKIGEIQLQGPTITPNYLNQSDKFKESWTTDGWFKTGDLGYCDPAGFLFIKSRLSELIISGGENIYPHEIESCLLAYPTIKEAAVIGMPDDKWGQVPLAFIVLTDPLQHDEHQLLAYLETMLAHYKIPKGYQVIAKLPRNASGKVLKNKLKKMC